MKLWAFLRELLSFVLGIFILLEQVLIEERAQLVLVAVGFACLGITGSSVIQRLLKEKVHEMTEP